MTGMNLSQVDKAFQKHSLLLRNCLKKANRDLQETKHKMLCYQLQMLYENNRWLFR